MKHSVGGQPYVECLVALALACLVTSGATAHQTNPETGSLQVKAITTEVIRGFCVGLNGHPSDDFTNNTTTASTLEFVPWTTNKSAKIVVPREPEYAYQVELFDAKGIPVAKKPLGKQVGAKFFKFDTSAWENGIDTRPLLARKIGEVTGSLSLFRAEDLFQIEKPGKYTLRIRFQIVTFPRIGLARGQYGRDLIRFPPLDYPLLKKSPTSTGKE